MLRNRASHCGTAAGHLDRRVVQLGAHAMRRAAGLAGRIGTLALVSALTALSASLPVGPALPLPTIDPGRVPADGRPGPDQPMRQSNMCARTITVADPNVSLTAPGFTMLNISKAWQYSTGNGVPVAIIDTGINPSRRLRGDPGGASIMSGDGVI